MDPVVLRELLARVSGGTATVDEAMTALSLAPFREVDGATIDQHRALRQGVPEVVFGERKTPTQIASIARALIEAGQNVLVTRLDEERARAVIELVPELRWIAPARVGRI